MQHRTFYESVLPVREDAVYILWEKSSRKTYTYNGFEAFVEAAHNEGTGTDWYFATAAFDAPRRKNEHVIALKSFRLDLDAGPDKFDPDEPAKAYESIEHAVAGLGEFVKATKLTPTHVVRSGHGLHVYFALDAEVDPGAWQPVASALQTVCVAHGLRADPAVTSDKGRLLRPLGSVHYSGITVQLLAKPRKPYSFVGFAAMVDALHPQGGTGIAARPAKANKSRAKELYDELSIEPTPYKASFHKAATKCAVLSNALAAPAKLHHDTWFKVMVVADNCVEGRALAHEISAEDADRYDGPALDKRLDTFESDFITCNKFAESAPQCQSCELFGKINGPKELGRLSDQQVEERGLAVRDDPEELPEEKREEYNVPHDFPTVEELGPSYRIVWTANVARLFGVTREKSKSKVADEDAEFDAIEHLTDDLFYFSGWVDASKANYVVYTVKVRGRDGRWTEHQLDAGIEVDRRALMTFLAKNGVHPASSKSKAFDLLQGYTMNLLNIVKNRTQRPAARERLGFQFDARGNPVYVQGAYAVNHEGELVRAQATEIVQVFGNDLIVPALSDFTGDVFPDEYWERVEAGAKAYTRGLRSVYVDKPLQQTVLLFGMASIMMPFVDEVPPNPHSGTMPELGGVISLYSNATGPGKSTLQTLIARAFYEPRSLKNSGGTKGGGSVVSTTVTAATLGSFPLLLDEVSNNEGGVVSNLVYKLSSGKDNVRATQSGGLRTTRGWSSVCIMSTNISQRDLLSAHRSTAVAEQARVLEFGFDGLTPPTTKEIATFRKWMAEDVVPNVGLVGMVIAREALAVGYTKLHEMAKTAMTLLEEKYQLPLSDRYYTRMAVAATLLHFLLKRAGMTFYNFTAVMEEFNRAVVAARKFIEENIMSTEEMLSGMLREFSPNMYLTMNELDPRGRGDKEKKVELALREPRGECRGRFVQNGRYAYLTINAARDWCRENGTTIGAVEREAIRKNLIHMLKDPSGAESARRQVLLTKGLRDAPPLRATCWKLNLAVLNFDVSEQGIDENVVQLRRDEPAQQEGERDETTVG